MKKIFFPIVGLRHHYYRNTLRALYRSAVGKMVYINIDKLNVAEHNAVVAYLDGQCLGYVRTGNDRAMACAALEASEYGVLMCKVVRTDSEQREVWVELVVRDGLKACPGTDTDVLADWQYDGPTLAWDPDVQRLQNQAGALMAQLDAAPEAWMPDMETALRVVEECGWADLSGTMRQLLLDILQRLTALAARHESFGESARRVQYTLDYLCSPEWQEKRVEALSSLASSAMMGELQQTLGPAAIHAVKRLPRTLCALYDRNPYEAMARLCYLRKSALVTSQVLTVLALRQHLLQQGIDLTDEAEHPARLNENDTIRQLMSELLATRDEQGKPLFSDRRQWYAVYRVLKEVRNYPSQMSDFCQRMRDMGMDRAQVPCVYDSFRKVANDLPKLTAPVSLWPDYGHLSYSYEQQCKVSAFLLQKLGMTE